MKTPKAILTIVSLSIVLLALYLMISKNLEATIYGSISGKVIDEETKVGIKGVKISLWRAKGDAPCAIAATDKDGNFRFEMLESGKYKLKFYPDPPYAFEDRFDEVYLEKGKIIDNLIKILKYGGAIAGFVYNGDGKTPLQGIRICADSSISRPMAWTNSQGYYKIVGLYPNEIYNVRIEEVGYFTIEIKEIKVLRKEIIPLDIIFDMNDPTGVEGTVTSAIDGKPLVDIIVGIQKLDEKGYFAIIETDQDGKYSILGAKQGSYALLIDDIEGGKKIKKRFDIFIQKGKKTKVDIVLNMPSITSEIRNKEKIIFAFFCPKRHFSREHNH